jgi:hypothetical protein
MMKDRAYFRWHAVCIQLCHVFARAIAMNRLSARSPAIPADLMTFPGRKRLCPVAIYNNNIQTRKD